MRIEQRPQAVVSKFPFRLLLLSGAAVFLAYYYGVEKGKSTRRVLAPQAASVDTNAVSKPPQLPTLKPVAISHGVVEQPFGNPLAPFEIKTKPGFNFFVKMRSLDGFPDSKFFIVGGSPFKFEMPLGSYELKYASGSIWYGEIDLFGPDTATFRADAVFEFRRSSEGYSGYTVELIRQAGGNLSTPEIPRSEF